MGYGIDILNNIRMNSSEEYQSRIPTATRNNISNVGQYIQQYSAQKEEFEYQLIFKIGKTIIESKMFKNKLARFKRGAADPLDIEEIFVEMAKSAGAYDYTGNQPPVYVRADQSGTKVVYHKENRKDFYKISIGDIDYRKCFKSEATFERFLAEKINSVYSGDAYDEWILTKNTLASFKDKTGKNPGYFDYEVLDMAKSTSKRDFAKEFVKTLRKAVQDASFASTSYNAMGVKTWTDPENLVLLVNKDVLVEVDVEQLASAFNISNTDMKVVPTIISMDDFGSLEDTYALLVDKDFFMIFDTLQHMETFRNAQGLFTNYFYHHHQVLSVSPFKTAIRLKKITPAS